MVVPYEEQAYIFDARITRDPSHYFSVEAEVGNGSGMESSSISAKRTRDSFARGLYSAETMRAMASSKVDLLSR